MLLTLFALASCGGEAPEAVTAAQGAGAAESQPSAVSPSAQAAGNQDVAAGGGDDEGAQPDGGAEIFAFAYRDFVIKLDQDITEVLDALGEPLGYLEAPSCAFDGIDRIFSFAGVQIHTYPVEGRDLVHTISLRDDSVSTMEGIYLGESPEAVFRAYGNDYEQEFDMYTFTRGLTTLAFLIEDDMVVAITYWLIIQ